MARPDIRRVAFAFRVAIGALLLAAGAAKIADLSSFLAAALAYRLPLSPLALELATIIVPWLELFTGMLLVAGVWLDAGWVAASGLSILFVAVVSQAALRGIPLECGCFGALSEKMPSFLNRPSLIVARDLLLAAVTLMLTHLHFREGTENSGRG